MSESISEVIELPDGTGQAQDKSIESGKPEGISPESWVGWWVNWKTVSIHTVLDDMFHAKGGCKGEIMDGTDPDQNGDRYDGYSYIIPYSTELQWRTRVLQSPYTNFFKRFIMAQIRSVFSEDAISYNVYKGSSKISEENDVFLYFMNNSTGTGVSYRDLQVFATQERKVHDVAYYIMTKPDGSEIPALTIKTAVDFIMATGDKNGKLEEIMFFNGKKIVNNKIMASAELWYMAGGICYVQDMEGEWDGKRSSLGEVEYKKVGPPQSTGVDEMVVKAHMRGAQPTGEFLPRNPESSSIAMKCMDYFQSESWHSWLMTLTRNPIPYVFTKADIKGLRAGGSQLWVLKGDQTGYPSAPDFMSPDSALTSVSTDDLNRIKQDISDIARESGVNTGSANSATQQSGESKAYDFIATDVKLQETVTESQEMNKWVGHMFNKYTVRNDDVWTYEITYPTDFFPEEPKSLDEIGGLIDKATLYGLPLLARELILFSARNVLSGSVSEETMNDITSEIESSSGVSNDE